MSLYRGFPLYVYYLLDIHLGKFFLMSDQPVSTTIGSLSIQTSELQTSSYSSCFSAFLTTFFILLSDHESVPGFSSGSWYFLASHVRSDSLYHLGSLYESYGLFHMHLTSVSFLECSSFICLSVPRFSSIQGASYPSCFSEFLASFIFLLSISLSHLDFFLHRSLHIPPAALHYYLLVLSIQIISCLYHGPGSLDNSFCLIN